MRAKTLVLSFLFSLTLFALDCCSINWGEPETQTVDQMLGGSRGQAQVYPLPPQTSQSSGAPLAGMFGNDVLIMPPNSSQYNETQWFNLALILYNQGKYNSSSQAYKKVIEINPENAAAWNNMGIDFGMLGRNAEALSSFNTATRINPSYAEAWFNMGEVYDTIGEYKPAISAYAKATKIKPDYTKAWHNMNYDIDIAGL